MAEKYQKICEEIEQKILEKQNIIDQKYFYQMIYNENIDEIKRYCTTHSVNRPISNKSDFYDLPIFHSLYNNKLKSFKVLLELGADVNLIPDGRYTILTDIINSYNIEFLKIIITKKPKFTFNNLYYCLKYFSLTDLEPLDIDWTITDQKGNNLLYTCLHDKEGIISFLLSKGVDSNIRIKYYGLDISVLYLHIITLRKYENYNFYFKHIRDLIISGKVVTSNMMYYSITTDIVDLPTSLNFEQQKYLLDASDYDTLFSQNVYDIASTELQECIDFKRSNYFSFPRSVLCLRKAGIEALYRPGGKEYQRSKEDFERLLMTR